ncbi:MAG: amino acid adenylation domain-containing protein [Cyanobacteria bacterium]|jgi:amino acid adenylation domain-containing protein/non-ribosomal peptide synthase protein (TIGR01720 family)|nr:amino acid adenylation domain-containing protein [Cyanobacteria bacterium GSL.Bin1]
MDISQRLANLSPEQRELLKRRLKQKGQSQGESSDKIPKRETDRALPLSFAQQRLWFLDRLEPDSPAYNLAAKVNIEGPLNVRAMEQTINAIIQRHEVWRTNFTANEQGQPRQIIASTRTIAIPLVDLGHLSPFQQEWEVSRLATQQAKTPFNLEQGPLLRATLLRLNPNKHIMVFTMHHIVSDGWSLGVLLQEVAGLYEAFCQRDSSPLPELPIQYADFAIWQRQQLQGGQLDAQLAYWKHQLANPPVLQLPTDYSRPPIQTFRGVREPVKIPQSLVDALSRFSQQQGVTLFMTLLAALKALLYRYTGQSDLIVGSPVAGRDRAELEKLIGFFVNMLVLRTDASGDPSFRAFLKRVQKVTLDAYSHQAVPFEKLVEELQPERELDRNPLYQVSLTLNNVPMPAPQLSELNLDLEEIDNQTTKLDLSLHLYPVADGLSGWFEYSTDLFHPDTIKRMVGHWQTLLQGIVDNPEQRLSALPLLTAAEEQQIREWNATQTDYPQQQCLHELVEAQVERTPDAIALVFENEQLTYRELNQRANQLAHHLQSLGVSLEQPVGICLKRSVDLVIALLGTLKAGGAYVPLDPDYPQQRLALMSADAQLTALVTQPSLQFLLPDYQGPILCLDASRETLAQEPVTNPCPQTTLEHLAYIIYTSGSTGTPKGVMNSHGGVSNRLLWMQERYGLTRNDRVLQKTPFSFDVSVWEFFWSLFTGACLVVAQPDEHKDPSYISQLIAQAEITTLHFVPSMLQMFLEVTDSQACRSLQRVICSGEALPLPLQQRFFQCLDAELHNLYGPTEAAIDVTAWQCRPQAKERIVPIGSPITNLEIYLLDDHFDLVPVGIPGEIYIGGAGLARGYVNRPELTAEKFIPHPFRQETRLYKTGDLGRYREDGMIEFLGRIDHQVKLRGLRLELGEVETLLAEHSTVKQSVVTVRNDEADHQHLVAYIVPEQQALAPSWQGEQVSQWESVFDKTYDQPSQQQDLTFNIAGWNSSYTDQPLPSMEMQEWVDQTVARILQSQPQQVLEIGCGTGLLLFRIVSHCRQYWGTDISATALNYIQQHLPKPQASQVHLEQRSADEFQGIENQAVDTVVLNSVVQYFPSIEYLVRVLERAVQVTQPGGNIFIGDVRSLPLLEAFHTAVQLYRAPRDLSSNQLQQRVQQRLAQEQELVIDPRFFRALQQYLPEIEQVRIQPKRGRYCNEMTQFRYDVTLQLSPTNQPSAPAITWLDWQEQSLTLNQIRDWLTQNKPERLGLKNVPNARIQTAIQQADLLNRETKPATVAQWQDVLPEGAGIDPETLWSLSDEFPYTVEIDWSRGEGTYDVLFQRETEAVALITAFPEEPIEPQSWSAYANNPLQGRLANQLVPQLRRYLQEQLPDYMVPSVITLLNELPLTANGKVDRNALPVPTFPPREQELTCPETALERTLATIWQEVLGLEQVGIHDNFFELGGDSLLSMQVVAKAKQAQLQLTPKQLFECQTIAELATTVTAATKTEDHSDQPITGSVPLTPIQHWFFEQEQPEPQHWNQAELLKLRTLIAPAILETAVQHLLVHHDALRLRFVSDPLGWQAVNDPPSNHSPFSHIDLSLLPATEQMSAMESVATQLQGSLDLGEGSLMRVALFELGAHQENRLLVIIHHLVVDGLSWRILLEDLQTACEQQLRGETIALPPKTASFKHWSEKLQDWVNRLSQQQEAEIWQQRLQDPRFRLPLDNPDGNNIAASTREITMTLTPEETQALLQEVPRIYHTEINDALLTALLHAIASWSGQSSIVVDLERHGRELPFAEMDISRTVGWFTALFPVCLTLHSAGDIGESLKAVKEQLRQIPNQGVSYGALRYLSKDAEIAQCLEDLSHSQILFNYLGQFDQNLAQLSLFELALENSGPPRHPQSQRSHLLEINSFVKGERLHVNWSYSTALHQASTIEGVAQRFKTSLRQLIEATQLVETSHYTPSDFPLINFKQKTLDTLLTTYPILEDIYPLSPIQEGILFHALYASDTEVYFEQWQCRLQGNLNRAAFQQAWQRVINRHPILRTSFHWEQLDDPVQIVHQQVELPWLEQNWQHLSASEQTKQLTTFEQRDRALGFNLSQAPLMRLSLIQMAEQSYQFIWSHHHLLIDGWSSAAILKEVFDCYQAFRQGREPSLTAAPPYRTYIHWLQQQDFAEARAFWQEKLRGFTAPTSLNRLTAGKSRQGETVGSQKQEVSLSQQQFRHLQSLAQTAKITLNAIFQGAWALLLSRYSGDRDVVFGTTVSGRPPDLAGSDSMIGVFINTLPVRAFVSSQNTLLPWLKQLQEQQAILNQYQCSPLADIHRWSDVPLETSLFETILVFQNYPIDESLLEQTNNDLTFHNVRSVTRNNYPLTLRVTPLNGILLQAIYDNNRFDDRAIAQLLQELKTLLQIMLDSSGSQLGKLLEQLEEKEKQQQAQQQQALKQSRRQKLGQIGRRSIKNR